MNDLISVIVPVYNCQDYLEDCVNSIISQPYKNIELLLIDDGSKDNSGAICDEFANNDSRIKVCHNENHGVSYTRNFGIQQSQGEYIMFCDSDDTYCENTFDKITEQIDTYPNLDLLIFGMMVSRNDSNENVAPLSGVYNRFQFGDVYLDNYKSFLINSPSNKVYKKSLIDETTVFPLDVSLGEDMIFCNSIIRKCDTIVTLDEPLYIYKQRESDSLSTKYYDNLFEIYYKHYQDVDYTLSIICKNWDRTKCLDLYLMYCKYIKQAINMTGDKKNNVSFIEHLKQIRYICNHSFTRECVQHLSNNNLYDIMLKNKMAFGLVVYLKLAHIKSYIKSR